MITDRNLLAWYAAASDDHRTAGLDWYPEADALASRISDATRGAVTHRQACGVIAALSPRCSWPQNKVAALTVVTAWKRGDDPYTLRISGVYPENIAKAYRILSDASFETCAHCRAAGGHRKTCSAALRGPKVVAFFSAIVGSSDDGAMDVWATRAARVAPAEVSDLDPADPRREGVPGSQREYDGLAASYRRAAAAVNVTPRQFQAVVWLVIRDSWVRADGRVNGVRLDQDLPF